MMRVLFLAVCMFGVTACGVLAQLADVPVATKVVILNLEGKLVDNKSLSEQKPEDLEKFLGTYTKETALLPECVASGYSIITKDKTYQFNDEANARVATFLKYQGSQLDVAVMAQVMGDQLMLIAIKNK